MIEVLKRHILPALLSGARNGLALERAGLSDPLQALSLTGQALRFERPAVPAAYQVEDEIRDNRAILPDTMRRPLLRLLTGKNQGLVPNAFPAAIARILSQRRLRLHPFDLPKLEAFVKGHADLLGAEASAFAQREAAPEGRRGYFEADALDDGTWAFGTPAARQAYIAQRRRQDPAAARALVEAVWQTEAAETRLRLLGALREGLGSGDGDFLASLDKDRAPRVRELAQRLLARLPGHEGDNPSLRNVMERIKAGQPGLLAGFLKRRTTLALELPATIKAGMAGPWINEAFGDIALGALAGALGLTVDEMVSAAEKDDNLLLAFAIMATHDRRFDVLDRVIGQLPDAWEQLARAGFGDLDDLTPAERQNWADIVVRPATWVQDMPLWGLTRLHDLLQRPVSPQLMTALFKSRPWQHLLRDEARLTVDAVDVMAVLCPPAQRPALRAQFAGLDTAKTANALTFLDIMDTLEATHA